MIYLANDHAGYAKISIIAKYLESLKLPFVWVGNTEFEGTDNYVDFTKRASELVAKDVKSIGIFSCGTGIGTSIVANRYPRIRAALCHNTDFAQLARAHNNANVLVIPGRFVTDKQALDLVNTFLNTPFEGGRHSERVDALANVHDYGMQN